MIWWLKLVVFRRRYLVRVHLETQVAGVDAPSVEGILVGIERRHYRLLNGRHLADSDRSWNLEGEAWLPRERVLYLQVIG